MSACLYEVLITQACLSTRWTMPGRDCLLIQRMLLQVDNGSFPDCLMFSKVFWFPVPRYLPDS